MVIFFDIDDTLVDHGSAIRAAVETLHRTVVVNISLEEFFLVWTSALKRHFDRYLAGELSYESQRRARVHETIDPTMSDEAADRVFATYLASYEAHWRLFPDVLPCLERLARYRLGVISNGQAAQQRSKLQRTGILDRFDGVLISEECGCAKPNAAIFHRACSMVEESPQQSVYVGDLYDVDAVAARAAGLTGIWLDRAGRVSVKHAPPMIHSLAQLEEAMKAG
jgi:putative hydrolase of the HAD superfamily